MNKVIALVPMKGHSERVPDKNLKNFNGAPLYHAVVEALLEAKNVANIAINTDSERIKADVRANFPDVILIDRPEAIQGDFVSMNKVLEYDLSQLNGDYFLQTHSTNPLLKSSTIEDAIQSFFNHQHTYDSVFSVTKWQTRLYWEDVKPINHNPQELLRTQDLPGVYEENSNFFIFSKKSFEASGGKRIGLRPQMYEVNKLEATDIDNPEDFIIAELLASQNLV